MNDAPVIDEITARAYTVPTQQQPESDGTFKWDSTTLVLVEAEGGGETGLGYSYTHAAAAKLIDEKLAGVVEGCDALAVRGAWHAMIHAVRNLGRPGLVSNAVAVVDTALWDLKARLLGQPLTVALDAARERVPIYGSGGFTSYSRERLQDQLAGWVEAGIGRVKMKVGREPEKDPDRLLSRAKVIKLTQLVGSRL